MKEKIGNNAGSVWTVLNAAGGRKSLKDIKKLTKLTDKNLYAALGWLAREDKIAFVEEDEIFIVLA